MKNYIKTLMIISLVFIGMINTSCKKESIQYDILIEGTMNTQDELASVEINGGVSKIICYKSQLLIHYKDVLFSGDKITLNIIGTPKFLITANGNEIQYDKTEPITNTDHIKIGTTYYYKFE